MALKSCVLHENFDTKHGRVSNKFDFLRLWKQEAQLRETLNLTQLLSDTMAFRGLDLNHFSSILNEKSTANKIASQLKTDE